MNHFREVEGLPISLISERSKFTPPAGPVKNNPEVEDTKTGTTTVGLVGKNFVVLAADQRSTMGHIANKDVRKVYDITSHIGLTIAGTVGDSLALIRFLRSQANLYEIERETKMTPKALSSLLSNVLNGNRYFPFIFQPIIGGINNNPELYELTPYGGVSEQQKYAITGSGTTFAMTTLDSDYKEGMTEEQAIALAVKAISAAKNRDIYSGGDSVTVVVIDDKGYREISRTEVDKIVHKIKFN